MAQLDNYGLTTQGADKYNYKLQENFAKVPKSRFNLGNTVNLTAEVGKIIPICSFMTIPASDYSIRVTNLVRCINPPVVPVMSRMTMYTHFFWCSMSQLWANWQVFFTKGHMGDVELEIPRVEVTHTPGVSSESISEGTLTDYLNFPYYKDTDGKERSKVPLMKYMMYLKVYRDYFMNEELHKSSKAWWPDKEEDFRLQGTNYNLPDWKFESDPEKYDEDIVPETGDCFKNLGLFSLRDRDWGTDYFTAARITPMRGPVPYLPIETTTKEDLRMPVVTKFLNEGWEKGNDVELGVMLSEAQGSQAMGNTLDKIDGRFVLTRGALTSLKDEQYIGGLANYYHPNDNTIYQDPENNPSMHKLETILRADSSLMTEYQLTVDKLKTLEEKQIELQKKARTDGTFGQEMQTFFGERPKSANDYRPLFIGGCKQPITFSEVLQTAEGKAPIGTMGGHAFSMQQQGDIGHLHADDYGILMGVISIVPETLYHGGWNREDLWSVQEDLYIPERATLAPQGILNGELKYTKDDEWNNKVFGYTNIFDNLRSRRNEVHGKFANLDNKSFAPYTFMRSIPDGVNLNQDFATLGNNNVRRDWLSAEEETPFGIEINIDIQATMPMPYDGTPTGL